MARISGVDLPRTKRVEIALTYIYGIGRHRSNLVLASAGALLIDASGAACSAVGPNGQAAPTGLSVGIPMIDARDESGVETVTWVPVLEEIRAAGWYTRVWQSFAVVTPVRTVGVMGDKRTYDEVVAVRIVTSDDGMTADWVRLPYEVLAVISSRIVNEVKGINRVVYDVTSNPPATIEWE